MSAAPNNRARLTRYNVAAKVGSSSLSLVRVQEGDFRWLKRRRWLKSYCCCREHVFASERGDLLTAPTLTSCTAGVMYTFDQAFQSSGSPENFSKSILIVDGLVSGGAAAAAVAACWVSGGATAICSNIRC